MKFQGHLDCRIGISLGLVVVGNTRCEKVTNSIIAKRETALGMT
jgi:class 3 adenylate cyclase